ncbi:unnamed protein product [Cuscuta campestris]|uniref:Purine permease n=1 Tax=Cuscuta campestris TaxID=132261 RepID=A0A484L2D9_9ASTE|nr:unnamed protein product [Cuscuta campestris]
MEDDFSSSSTTTKTSRRSHTWWLRITVYAVFLVAGQSSATLLGRFYYDKGGNSKWIATLVQSAGFPSLIPLFFFFSRSYKTSPPGPTTTSLSREGNGPLCRPRERFVCLGFLYVFFGVLLAGDNMMYSYGLLFLPVSTYSLLCATQLAFNAAFSFFINAQRFTALLLNSLVVVTVSAALLAVHSDDTTASRVSRGKYVAGFLCTVGASAAYSLYLSLLVCALLLTQIFYI